MRRDEKGRILPGPMDEETKRLISEGQIRRYRRVRSLDLEEPVMKRCTKCGKWKDRKDDFPQRKRKLACGEVNLYPAGECLECNAKRSAAYREKLRHEGIMAAKQAEWNSHRDEKARKAYQREYGRFRRALDGATPRGPWKRYREVEQDCKVPRGIFDDWIAGLGMTAEELEKVTGISAKVFRPNGNPNILLSTVDVAMTRLGQPDQVAVLFPT